MQVYSYMRTADARPQHDGLRMTAQEYLHLPDDGFGYELIRGLLGVSPSQFFPQGNSAAQFARFLLNFLDEHPIGQVTQEVDIHFDDANVLRPDVCYVGNDQRQIIKGHIYGVPHLVCEVLSDGTKRRDLGSKSEIYLQFGVREYWIVDPMERFVEKRSHVPAKDDAPARWEIVRGDEIESAVLPGLVIVGAKLFPAQD